MSELVAGQRAEAEVDHVVTSVLTPPGTLELDFIATHERTPDGGYVARWDAPTAELPINLGTIRITPQGPDRTLLVYTVRKRYRLYPDLCLLSTSLGLSTVPLGGCLERETAHELRLPATDRVLYAGVCGRPVR